MKIKIKYSYIIMGSLLWGLSMLISCSSPGVSSNYSNENYKSNPVEIKIEAESYNASSKHFTIINIDSNNAYLETKTDGWIALDVIVPIAGRYKSQIHLSSNSGEKVICWIEDYYDNKDDRTYNVTGNMLSGESSSYFSTIHIDGTPLNKGLHKMKVHFDKGVKIDWVKFILIKRHEITPAFITQKTNGSEWKVVWSDEFEKPMIDTSKWTYDVGNWGWGNSEAQYYTENRSENVRTEDGSLIIEARKNDFGQEWTSGRLTTRGKLSFLYGKIEFRAKVPSYKGNWAAGWTLGDEYIDELSWPYCGEIDILESVGYEMDDITGNGIAHASAHSGAYYFKLGNQPTGVIEVKNMNNEYHIYSVEWKPDGINSFVDGRLYARYNDTSTDLSWPFSKPQNIILNLAIGGGWGGYQGIDEAATSQKMIIDYVRVYELH